MTSDITYPAEVHWAVVRERDELRAEVGRLRDITRKHGNQADEAEAEVERLRRDVAKWQADFETEAREGERLRAALLRLVELGEDDGSASDTAWKEAFEHAATLARPEEC
jgi:hypothetical protein